MSTEDEHIHSVSDMSATQSDPVLNKSEQKDRSHAEHIRQLRERLYARGDMPAHSVRHGLPQYENKSIPQEPEPLVQTTISPVSHTHETSRTPVAQLLGLQKSTTPSFSTEGITEDDMTKKKTQTNSFRKKSIILGIIFFLCALGVSSVIMLTGKNNISGENISIDVSGPIATGGGDDYSFQVAVANQNAVPIESATLIIEYPYGTKSATEDNKEIQVERKQLDAINKGELVNVQVKARLFGEENEEKEIKVSIDYRVKGSNAIFKKAATPLHLKISTSPVVVAFNSVQKVTSGQEMELKLIVQSNSPTPLSNVLVKVAYPDGFDFSNAKPDTSGGEDRWFFTTLSPSEKKTIIIHGLMTGNENDSRRFTASAGVADERDKNTLTATLATAQTDVTFEKSFLDVNLTVNGSNDDVGVIGIDESATVNVDYTNTLETTIYNAKIVVTLSGNALDKFEVHPSNGYYDSVQNTITWDSVGNDDLKEITPGQKHSISFSLNPKDTIGNAPEMDVKVAVQGQRVSEQNVPQELVGVTEKKIKVESNPVVSSVALYTSGPFTNTGPTPPVAEKKTDYTLMLTLKSGTNEITGAEVTAVLPQYIEWKNTFTKDDAITYNATTREIKWVIGDMRAQSATDASVQVSYTPSVSHIGTTPTILETQRFKATDRFTGTVLRGEHPAITTSLTTEQNDAYKDGRVRAE